MCAEIVPKPTGNFYLVIKGEQSPVAEIDWSLVYAFK